MDDYMDAHLQANDNTGYLTTSEAAIAMIQGKECVLRELDVYKWANNRFAVRVGQEFSYVNSLPESNNWKVKREPLKYSIDIWLEKDCCAPECENGSKKKSLARFLLGTTRWSPVRLTKMTLQAHLGTVTTTAGFVHKFRITVERIDE